MTRHRTGFTIVELLAVVAVIGVLVAIALPRYNGYKDRAKVAALRTDVRNTETAEESYYAVAGTYGALADLQTAGLVSLSPGDAMVVTGDSSGYSIQATDATILSSINSCGVQVGVPASSTTDGTISCP